MRPRRILSAVRRDVVTRVVRSRTRSAIDAHGRTMTARHTAIAAIADHQRRLDPGLHRARRRGDLRPVRLPRGRPAAVPREADLQPPPAGDRRPRAVRSGDRRRGRPRREGVGARPRRHPLHPLVRADDRLDRREARLVPDAARRRPDDRRVLRARTSSRASPMRARSRRAGSGRRSRPAATRPGTSRARSSSRSSRTASR